MGRGSGQGSVRKDGFAGVMGTRRGSMRGQALRDEREMEARAHLIEMLVSRSDEADGNKDLQSLYDFSALYGLGVTPGSELYQQLIENVSKSILGRGASFDARNIVHRAKLKEVLDWLASNKDTVDGPLYPVVDALTGLVKGDGRPRIRSSDLALIPDVLCRRKSASSSYRPLFQALAEHEAGQAPEWMPFDGLVPCMLLRIKDAGAESLGDELSPFVELVGQRLRDHVSSPVERKHVGDILASADAERAPFLTPLAEGAAAYQEWLEAEAKAAKAERRRATFEMLKTPLHWVRGSSEKNRAAI